ncbi:MAG: flagellar hook-length control protein FliK [Candidatus Cloacimonetes bacterium]|nr:flagellar hook-length control protein FliK [Candidatus Cloacimonadota bacterium]
MSLFTEARVLGVLNQRAILLVSGKAVTVSNAEGLKEGQLLRTTVEGTPDKPKLGQTQVLAQSKPASMGLTQVLDKLAVPKTEANYLAAYKALQMGIPLDARLFQVLQKIQNTVPLPNEFALQAALLLVSLRLPVSKSSVDLLWRYYEGKLALKKLMGMEFQGRSLGDWIRPDLEKLDERGLNLKKMLSRSGINAERDLLQGDAVWQWGSELPEEGRYLKKQIKDLLSAVQLIHSGLSDGMLFALPYLNGTRASEMILRYRKAKKKAGVGEVKTLDLYFEMSELGPLNLTFELYRNHLSLWFRSSNDKTVEYLRQNAGDFREELSSEGKAHSVSIYFFHEAVEIPKIPQQYEKEGTLEGLDVRA